MLKQRTGNGSRRTRIQSMPEFIERFRTGLSNESSPEVHPLSGREFMLVCAFWALFGLFTVANRAVSLGWANTGAGDLSRALIVAVVEASAWTLLTPMIFSYAARSVTSGSTRLAKLGWAAALAIPISLVMSMGGVFLRLGLHQFPADREPISTLRLGLGFGLLNALIIYAGIVAAGLARTYSLRYQARQRHATQLEAQLASAQLDALRRQLDPHFLFNTLNLISAIADSDPSGVRRMIARLSELLRFSLDGGDAREVPLRQEMAILDRYLDIMRMRFRERLTVVINIADEALDALVPTLILQPLVENAIKHGVEKLRGTGRVEIAAEVEGETIVLCVRDNGPGSVTAGNAQEGPGVGVRNTMARLQQLYGSSAQFALRAANGGGTVAEIRLPRRSNAVLHTRAVSVQTIGRSSVE